MTPKEAPAQERAEQVSILYQQAPLLFLANLLVFSIAAWTFWDGANKRFIAGWWIFQSLLNALRWLLVRSQRRWWRPVHAPAWAWAFATGTFVYGLAWSALAGAVFDPVNIRPLLFVCVFITGIVAASIATLPWHFPSFLAFMLASLTPLMLRCLAQPERLLFSVGLALLSFAAFSALLARRVRAQMVQSVRLSHRNLDLVEQLRREKARAERASSTKSRFLAAVSHDLRQPVNALLLYSESLRSRGTAARIQTAARGLAGTLHSLLDLSAIESGARKPHLEDLPLGPLLRRLKADFKAEALRYGSHLQVVAPRAWTRSDPEMLERILRNLLHNAIRHGRAGRVRVTCTAGPEGLVLSVSDQGPGIPPDVRDAVFEEFRQLGNPERDPAQGLGLGLPIVRGLCSILDHPLSLRSVPELPRGTCFSLRLPKVPPARRRQKISSRFGRLDGLCVLIIDDHRPSLDAAARLLRRWRVKVLAARGPEEARSWLRRGRRPDAILCDYRLRQSVNGVEFLEDSALAGIPAAIITGDTHAAAARRLKASGYPVLLKPLVPGRLKALLINLSDGRVPNPHAVKTKAAAPSEPPPIFR